MPRQLGCLFSGLHFLGKAKENLQTQELFLKEGSLGEEHGGGGKASPSNGHSVSLSTGGLIFILFSFLFFFFFPSLIPTDKYKHRGP